MASKMYSYQKENEGTARALGRSLRISFKEAYEVANAIRGKKISRAKQFLADVIAQKEAVPYRRFNIDVAHKRGIGPGRYPANTSRAMIRLLTEVEANAGMKGMNVENLEIIHIATHQAMFRYGSYKGSPHISPMTHVEVVVKEGKESAKKQKAPVKKATEKKSEKATVKTEQKGVSK